MCVSRAALLVGLLLQVIGAVAAAQTPTSPTCTYTACALRVEPVFLGVALVRGANSDSTVRLNGFGHGVDILLGGPDSAAFYGRRYVAANMRSSMLSTIGVAALIVVAARTHHFESSATTFDGTVAVVGGTAFLVSIPFTLQSQRSLARSVWWYNAALPR